MDRFSLRWRVPAVIAAILVAAVAMLSVLAYGAAKRSAIDVASERLRNAAQRLADLSGAGVTTLIRTASTAAEDPAVIQALRNAGEPMTPAARAALRRVAPDTLPVTIALFDVQGRPVEGVTPELAREGPAERLPAIDEPAFYPLRAVNGVPEFIVAVPVKDSGRVIGQLVQWRRVTRVTASLRVLSDLIGERAVLLLGNADGSVAIEMSDTLHPPVIRDSSRARRARELNSGASAQIPGTPWAWTVEFPNEIILRPLKILSWQSLLLALLVVILAVAAGTLLSRGMTSSLADLTTSVEAVAGGDLSQRPVSVQRRDEIGRLARSFSSMADRIRESRDQLERRIEERTSDLQNTMTQLRDAQDELVRKEKLAAIGQLASSVGHELRNPLGVMSNAVYILERTMDPPPKGKEYLRVLDSQIRLSERIVGDLLDSARNPTPRLRCVSVRELLEEQVTRVTVPAHVRLDVVVAEGLPGIQVDPDQVGQILVNLLTNAVQAMDDEPGQLSVHASDGAGHVRIDVRDTGPGVPVAHIDKIFEPLYTTKARGIGLGLSVSRSLATANRGNLSVMNHPDGGAVFTLVLPAGESH
jgi:signal transduction histidine kinase